MELKGTCYPRPIGRIVAADGGHFTAMQHALEFLAWLWGVTLAGEGSWEPPSPNSR